MVQDKKIRGWSTKAKVVRLGDGKEAKVKLDLYSLSIAFYLYFYAIVRPSARLSTTRKPQESTQDLSMDAMAMSNLFSIKPPMYFIFPNINQISSVSRQTQTELEGELGDTTGLALVSVLRRFSSHSSVTSGLSSAMQSGSARERVVGRVQQFMNDVAQ